MTTMWGADIAQLAALGQTFRVKAEALDAIAANVSGVAAQTLWEGGDAIQFDQVWNGEHRARLHAIATQLRASGDALLQQAREQEQASNAGGAAGGGRGFAGGGGGGGGGGSWGPGGGATWGPGGRWPTLDEALTYGGGLFSALDEVHGLRFAEGAGNLISVVDYGIQGYGIGDDLANGRYVDAGLGALFVGGDLSADAAKASGHYPVGVAIQSVTEAVRAGAEVDWSAEGLGQIRDASLGDWGEAFGEALVEFPTTAVKIFGL